MDFHVLTGNVLHWNLFRDLPDKKVDYISEYIPHFPAVAAKLILLLTAP